MSLSSQQNQKKIFDDGFINLGLLWLIFMIVMSGAFFWNGIEELLENWQLPEYSHGPLIPILSGLLFSAST